MSAEVCGVGAGAAHEATIQSNTDEGILWSYRTFRRQARLLAGPRCALAALLNITDLPVYGLSILTIPSRVTTTTTFS